MIITLKGANFSASNIGTLDSWFIQKVLGKGCTYSGPTSVKKDSTEPFIATVTIAEGYETSLSDINVTMGQETGGLAGNVGVTLFDNVVTINIERVTGNIRIEVATTAIAEPEPEAPANYTFTINPTPTSATVTLSATGYSTVSGTGSKSITVANGTKVDWKVEASGYTTRTGDWTISGGNKTENITLTASGGGGGTSDKLAGTWVFNNDTLTDEELTAFGGFPAKDLGLSYSAYTGYKVSFTIYKSGTEINSEYLIKSNNNVILGYDKDGSAIGFATNGSLGNLDDRAITIHSNLSEVTGGPMLLDWLNSVATNTTNPDSSPEQPEEGGTVGEDELAGTWTMNTNISATPSTFGGKNGKSGLGLDFANLYQGYALNYTAGTETLTHLLVHTSVENMLGKVGETSTGVGALYINDAWSPSGARYITVHSKLSEVDNGNKLLAWFKANGTKTS